MDGNSGIHNSGSAQQSHDPSKIEIFPVKEYAPQTVSTAEQNRRARIRKELEDRIENYKTNFYTGEPSEESKAIMEQSAVKAGLTKEDAVSDGILGSTASAPTKNCEKPARAIWEAVQELMKDPKCKEMLQACVLKKGNVLAATVPGRMTHAVSVDYLPHMVIKPSTDGVLGFLNKMTGESKKEYKYAQNIAGDPEMIMLVGILNEVLTGPTRAHFSNYDDKEALKKQIMFVISQKP